MKRKPGKQQRKIIAAHSPSRKAVQAARTLLAFTRRAIKVGMDKKVFWASRPANLHDELKFFLDVFDA